MNSTYNPFILIVALTGLSLTAGAQSSGELQLRIVAVAPDGVLRGVPKAHVLIHRNNIEENAVQADSNGMCRIPIGAKRCQLAIEPLNAPIAAWLDVLPSPAQDSFRIARGNQADLIGQAHVYTVKVDLNHPKGGPGSKAQPASLSTVTIKVTESVKGKILPIPARLVVHLPGGCQLDTLTDANGVHETRLLPGTYPMAVRGPHHKLWTGKLDVKGTNVDCAVTLQRFDEPVYNHDAGGSGDYIPDKSNP